MADKAAASIARMAAGMPICSTPFCGRPTMAAAKTGFAQTLCKRCIQHKARHGSSWCPSIPGTVLKYYAIVASAWLSEQLKAHDPRVSYACTALDGLLRQGFVEPAQDIKWRTPEYKARVAFARMRETNLPAVRLLAMHIATGACIEDDAFAHRTAEYRIVQTAKALHRLASGSHYRYEWPTADGRIVPIAVHNYPRSSGMVLRVIGEAIDEACGSIAETALEAVRSEKRERFGPHPSTLPGYKPPWQTQREKALSKANTTALRR